MKNLFLIVLSLVTFTCVSTISYAQAQQEINNIRASNEVGNLSPTTPSSNPQASTNGYTTNGGLDVNFIRETFNTDARSAAAHMNDSFFVGFIEKLTKHVYTFVVKMIYEDLVAELDKIFFVFTTCWFVWNATKFAFGQAKIVDIFLQFLLIIFASSFMSQGGASFFINYFYNPLFSAFFGLSDFMISKAMNVGEVGHETEKKVFLSGISQLENLWKAAAQITDSLEKNVPSLDIGKSIKMFVYGMLIKGGFLALTLLFCCYWSYAIFALHVFLALSPLMFMLAVFKTTRQYFQKWFSAVINYLTIPVILSISMGLTISIINTEMQYLVNEVAPQVAEGGGELSASDQHSFRSLILMCAISFLVHLRVGEMAAFLTGGVSAGLSSSWSLGAMAFAPIGYAMGKTMKGLESGTAKGAVKLGGKAANVMKDVLSSKGKD